MRENEKALCEKEFIVAVDNMTEKINTILDGAYNEGWSNKDRIDILMSSVTSCVAILVLDVRVNSQNTATEVLNLLVNMIADKYQMLLATNDFSSSNDNG